jgi:preprotein translocase subunit YajC
VDQYGGLLILAVPLVLLWLFTARTRRQQRTQGQLQASLQPGSRVMTTSGLMGTVVSADDPETVVLEIAPGLHTTWVRPAIARVVDRPGDELTVDDPEDVVDDGPGNVVDVRADEADGDHSDPSVPVARADDRADRTGPTSPSPG